jgi:hypothetical protein
MTPLDVVGLVVIILLVIVGALFALRTVVRRKEASARVRYPDARHIDRAASFFGQQSRGPAQMRGSGLLILTGSELIFEMLVPSQVFRIPLGSIQAIEHPTSFLGKTRFAPLLKVIFLNDQGEADAMAWQVPDLEGWTRMIHAGRG